MTPMRLQRALARAGVTSRRKAEALIRAGRVRVDGQLATLGMSVDPARQRVTLDGRAVRPGPVTWLALNKPVGYVVSRKDPEGRRTVFELVPKVPGLTYVGRLDVMTSGLLLLTTDGAAAHRLMHPRFAVPRTYWLRAHGRGVAEVTSALGSPIALDGRPVRVTAFRVRPGPVTWLALNKPIGYVVSRGDPEGRRTVYTLLPNVPGLTYVGRLDVMTSGLLLFTTDGVAAHRLMHPRFAVPRTYWLRVHGHGAAEVRAALARPPAIDGRPVRVVDFRVRLVERSIEVEITLAEGRQRIVRRLAEALGLKVEWLHRVSYGPVRLGRLAEGKYRRLAANEVEAIERLHGPA